MPRDINFDTMPPREIVEIMARDNATDTKKNWMTHGVCGVLLQIADKDPVKLLNSMEIYGTDIWHLFRNICNEDFSQLVALLQACELKLFPEVTPEAIKEAIKTGKHNFDFPKIKDAVNRHKK